MAIWARTSFLLWKPSNWEQVLLNIELSAGYALSSLILTLFLSRHQGVDADHQQETYAVLLSLPGSIPDPLQPSESLLA